MKKTRNRMALLVVLALCVACALPGLSASAEFIGTFPMNSYDLYYEFYSSSLPITGVALLSGGMPVGVEVYWDDYTAYITGVPQTMGNYSALFAIATSEAVVQTDISLSITEAPAVTADAGESAEIIITKSPTGEWVEVGDTAKFVARANNAEKIVWRLVSNDTTNTVHCTEAADYFPGLQVSGLGTETLVLSNIPRSLDGWRVEAQFWSGKQHKESNGALITIVNADGDPIGAVPTSTPEPFFTFAPSVGSQDMPVDTEARTANISYQPQSAELVPGENYTLSVLATSPNNGSLSYQWYSYATDDRSRAVPITGATEASYTINQADGTAYYWVAVWNTKDGSRSQAVYSDAAAVSIVSPATPTPVPVPTPTVTPVPTPVPRANSTANLGQLVLYLVIGGLALIALIGVVIYMRADSRQRAAEAEENREKRKK